MIRQFLSLCFLSFMITLMSSCTHSDKKKPAADVFRGFTVLKIDDKFPGKPLAIDSLIDTNSLTITPLENSEACLLGIAAEIFFKKKTFYVMDPMSNKVAAFDTAGQFKFFIGKYGLAQNQYNSIEDVRINKFSNTIEISDINSRLFKFDLEGRFLRQDSLVLKKYKARLFYPLSDSAYAVYNSFLAIPNDKSYRFYITDGKNTKYKTLRFDTLFNVSTPSHHQQFYEYGDTVRFFEPFFPVIYNISGFKCIPKYRFQFARTNLSKENTEDISAVLAEVEKYHLPYLDKVLETKRCLFIHFSTGNQRYYCIYDKAGRKSLGFTASGFYLNFLNLPLVHDMFLIAPNEIVTTLSSEEIFQLKRSISKKKVLSAVESSILAIDNRKLGNLSLIRFKLKN